ncbi:hypothetical protein AK812_SmicGene22840 [Symbiodinium microadriaticum]|uniref:AAA+ ATPase domain-containing protein n=1 Tax=Symbiodinium microadriaticum TaxID=2951 RepID=A0A1Q9DIP1_SYMMI|nr:hypothetical protein AK812_SmicGene22840 [Symbiodinium microadriaticum]
MQPYEPKTKKPVVHRAIFEAIKQRIKHWESDATIIAGRFGSGKSVAVREALRGVQGVFVHSIEDADWKDKLFKRLGLAGPDMLEDVLCRVQAQLEKLGGLSKVPIIVLDIPRTTMEGMDTVSSFAKYLCSDDTMKAAAHVIVCASSAAMAMAFDAGGEQRQKNYWVEDFTDDEAKEFLALRGHREDWEQFVQACGYRALDLDLTCGDYEGPATLAAKKEEMDKKARKEVLRFKDQCKIAGDTGKEILEELLANRQAGKGADELCTAASPKDVAMWIRERGYHSVIWHTVKQEYQFASELHANAATEILKSTPSRRHNWP